MTRPRGSVRRCVGITACLLLLACRSLPGQDIRIAAVSLGARGS